MFRLSFFLSKPTILKPGYASSWQETSNFNDLKRNNTHLFLSLSHLGCTNIYHLSFWGSISSKRLRATGLKCSVRGYFWSQLFRDHFYVSIVFRNLKKVGNHWSRVRLDEKISTRIGEGKSVRLENAKKVKCKLVSSCCQSLVTFTFTLNSHFPP